MIKFVSDLRQVGGFSAGPPVSSTNKTDCHDIADILLKVALNTISNKQTNNQTIVEILFLLVNSRRTNNKLSIKAERWQNIDKVPRFCNLYNKQQIGDTYHYISEYIL